jgi:hypothetical protein
MTAVPSITAADDAEGLIRQMLPAGSLPLISFAFDSPIGTVDFKLITGVFDPRDYCYNRTISIASFSESPSTCHLRKWSNILLS